MVLSKHNGFRRGAWPLVDPEFAQALEEDDGGGHSGSRHGEHKARQLCRQVQRALNLALGERSSDPALDGLFVMEVTPIEGSGRLLVHIVVSGDQAMANVLAGLRQDAPRLRTVVARAISRKRAPELSFVPACRSGDGDV